MGLASEPRCVFLKMHLQTEPRLAQIGEGSGRPNWAG